MKTFDTFVFAFILLVISIIGIFFSRRPGSTKTHIDLLVGSNVSTFSIALSVCSSFLSAVSLLGFPAEIYYRGTSPIWYFGAYLISFPLVAFLFLPVFYNLKILSIYEYLEKRFCFASRLISSLTFILQTICYLAIAIYAPSLAFSQCFNLPVILSIFVTAFISAVYLFASGARGGIYTSAFQMALILFSLFVACVSSMAYFNVGTIWQNAERGRRLEPIDLRVDPRIRHSMWSFLVGGSGNILALFASNQLTMQRYIVMPSLKQAQRVILLNIPLNASMLFMYTIVGVMIYSVYHGCHPSELQAPDQILPYFIENQLNWIIGLEGLFMAAIYSAGVSTLTNAYNALSAVFIEDIIKIIIAKRHESRVLNAKTHMRLIRVLPFCFAFIAMLLATLVGSLNTMVLQSAFSIFGAAGGAILSIFVVGLFCPKVNSKYAALAGQIAAILSCGFVAIGSLYYNVTPVNLPLSSECLSNSSSQSFAYNPSYGTVTAFSYDGFWVELSKVSYQYYSIIGVLTCVIVAHLVQFGLSICGLAPRRDVNSMLLVHFLRAKPPNIVIEAAESQCLRNSDN
ncbi:Sodium:solute symporter family protein [Aphelenchoides besseyi]|nr:Sodium:solute symporter family protein [Aphelenchoides besseyi]